MNKLDSNYQAEVTEINEAVEKVNAARRVNISVPRGCRSVPPLPLISRRTQSTQATPTQHGSFDFSPQHNDRIRKRFRLPKPRVHSKRRRPWPLQPLRPQFSRLTQAKVVPQLSRRDPVNYPPNISEADIGDGLLMMLSKGLIPKDADLSPAFQLNLPPLSVRSSNLHDWGSIETPRKQRTVTLTAKPSLYPPSQRRAVVPPVIEALGDPDDFNEVVQEVDNGPFDYYPILFKRGKLRKTNYYQLFKQRYEVRWGFIRGLLTRTERYCKEHRIAKLILDGKKFYDTFVDEVSQFSTNTLLSTVLNKEELAKHCKTARIIYKGPNGRHLAALKLQTAWRMFKASQEYRYLRELNKRATTIQTYFRLYLEKLETKRRIANIRSDRINRMKNRQAEFRVNWPTIKQTPRVEVHLGSHVADELASDFYTSQNHSINRVFRVWDPLVSVIYVSPIPLHSEIPYYYHRFLERCQVSDVQERVKFFSPEHGLEVSEVMYTTAKLLSLAFKTINDIKALVADCTAYLVPGQFTDDDIIVADLLGIPILSGDLDTYWEYNNKQGTLDILKRSNLPLPVTSTKAFEDLDAFYTELTHLMFDNAATEYWVLKLNSMKEGRGLAFINTSQSKFFQTFRKKYEKDASSDLKEIKAELQQHLHTMTQLAQPTAWTGFDEYMNTFLTDKGLIQAAPPRLTDDVTSPCVAVLLEPDRSATYIGTIDKVQSHHGLNVGGFFPQQSVVHSTLLEATRAVTTSMLELNMYGFFTLEFLAFPDSNPEATKPKFWGIDINFGVDFVACGLLQYQCLVGGLLDLHTGKSFVEIDEDDDFTLVEDVFGDDFTNMLTTSNPRQKKVYYPLPSLFGEAKELNYDDMNAFDERTFSLVWHLEHPDIRELSVGAFFHMCRLESAIYNLETFRGSAFSVYNVPACKYVGVIAIDGNRKESLKAMTEVFSFIIQQAGPPPLPETVYTHKEQLNLTEILAKFKTLYLQLEKQSKTGKRNFVVS